jgi:hypothetical protein
MSHGVVAISSLSSFNLRERKSMTSRIDIPDTAVVIWKEGNSIVAYMDGHAVRIPLADWEWTSSGRKCSNSDHPLAACPMGGLRQVALLLKARGEFSSGPRTIGEAAMPTQWDVENKTLTKLARAEERVRKALAKQAADKQAEAALEAKREEMKKISAEDLLKEIGLL